MSSPGVTLAKRGWSPKRMNTAGEITRLETLKELKPLLSTTGPCLSVYLQLSKGNGKQNELRWRECLRLAESRVDSFGSEGKKLLESVADWSSVAPEGPLKARSIAVFRCGDAMHVTLLDEDVQDRAVLAPHLYIRPLLTSVTRDNTFYLLALSQKNTRLLYCTRHKSEEIPLPAEIKTDFDAWMNEVKPDHTLVYNAVAGPSSGGNSKGALAPKGADREAKDEYLAHYFKQIDKGVGEVLRGKTEPLVLCGVEYEIPIYGKVNNYPHLAKENVHGAPNGLKAGEMHARALEAIDRCYADKVDTALAEWNHKVGGGASSRLKDVVTAAHDGRVLTLLVSDSFEKTGTFNEDTHTVTGRETGTANDEDLINDAAVQTVLHSGKLLLAPHSKMPNGAVMAAIYRF
jgi:release factor family 3